MTVLFMRQLIIRSEHWNEFQYVFDLLQPTSSGQIDGHVHSQSNWHPSTSLVDAFANDSSLSAWISALDGPEYLTASPQTSLDSRVMLNALAQAIHKVSRISWLTCPTVLRATAEDDHSGKTKASFIYRSLLSKS